MFNPALTLIAVTMPVLYGVAAAQSVPGQPLEQEAIAIASSQLRAGSAKQALLTLKSGLKLHPASCPLLSLEALAYVSADNKVLAAKAYAAALRMCPDYLPALEGDAQLQFAERQPEAVPLLQRVLALQPANTAAHSMLAMALAREESAHLRLHTSKRSGSKRRQTPAYGRSTSDVC